MLLLALSLLTPAHADCMSGSLSVWPEAGSTIPAEGQVVLHAYGSERPRLAGLGDGDVVLARGDEQIPLKRTTTHTGSFQDDQAVYVPARLPDAGEWTLQLHGQPLTLWTGKAHAAVSWTVSHGQPDAPRWTAAPEVVDRSRQHFGCGPGVDVSVLVPTTDAPWVETTLSGPGDAVTTARIPVRDGRISIGHGMCSGLFELVEGQTYEATFVAIGPDGQRAPSPHGPIRFEAP